MAGASDSVRDVYYMDLDIDPGMDRDPLAALAPVAREHAIIQGHDHVFGGVRLPNNYLFATDRPMFLALSYAAAKRVLSDEENFSAAGGYGATLGKTLGKVLFTIDEPEHGRYRNLVAKAFMHRNVTEQWMESHVVPVIDGCLASFEQQGRGDLVQLFTLLFPYRVIARITGVPEEYDAALSEFTLDALTLGGNPDAAMRAYDGMNQIFGRAIVDHRFEPRDDLIGALIDTEIDGDRLSDDEISSFLRNLIAAGLDTTYRATGNLLYQLFEDPVQFAALRAEPALLDTAIWESLRMIPPGGISPRTAKNAVEVEGVAVPADLQVLVCFVTANHDHRIWDDPLRFDIRRPRKPILTFGAGVHTCLGNNLARVEIRLAMESLLRRLGDLRPDPERWGGATVRGFGLRSPDRLPALWNPSG